MTSTFQIAEDIWTRMVENPDLQLVPALELAADAGVQSERERFAEYFAQIVDDFLCPDSLARTDAGSWVRRVAAQIAAGDTVDTTGGRAEE